LAQAIDITPDEPVLVTLDFSEFWSLPDGKELLPVPKFSCRQWTTRDSNSFGVKYHLREVRHELAPYAHTTRHDTHDIHTHHRTRQHKSVCSHR
jgi:hypothetical protein